VNASLHFPKIVSGSQVNGTFYIHTSLNHERESIEGVPRISQAVLL